MDDSQRVTVALCLIGMLAVGLGSFLYVNNIEEEQARAKANRELDFAVCSLTLQDLRGKSLTFANKSVKKALECAASYSEFRAFKDLYDERSPDSPNRKPYDPDYWPNFP